MGTMHFKDKPFTRLTQHSSDAVYRAGHSQLSVALIGCNGDEHCVDVRSLIWRRAGERPLQGRRLDRPHGAQRMAQEAVPPRQGGPPRSHPPHSALLQFQRER